MKTNALQIVGRKSLQQFQMKQFRAPRDTLGDLDAEAAATLISTAADVALVIDGQGVIRDVAFNSPDLLLEGYEKWLGQPWSETVTVESQQKVVEMLQEAASHAPVRKRQVNHPSSRGADVPVLYSAVQVAEDGRVVAVGRDLRAVAALQQRLVDAQQSMERDYARLRYVETRYRLLFQMTSEAVLIVDPATRKVMEANPAAAQLFDGDGTRVIGQVFPTGFEVESTRTLQTMLDDARAAGQTDEVQARMADSDRELRASATLFRQENTSLFLVRLCPVYGDIDAAVVPRSRSRLLDVIDKAPDGFCVTTEDGHILATNPAFLDLAQLATEGQVKGQSLERWLGRPGVDLNVLIANLREYGSVRLFATTLRGEYGSVTEVEISAVSISDDDGLHFGFLMRNVGRRLTGESRVSQELPRSVEQLTELVGRAPLKDIVRKTTDVIERLCIEAALDLTGDNRASAAEILGLSRQSFYVKLRRYGLGDLSSDTDDQR